MSLKKQSLIEYQQTEFSTIISKSSYNVKLFHPRDAGVVQNTQTFKCNTAQQQKENQTIWSSQ
jgi:hypothetical protein